MHIRQGWKRGLFSLITLGLAALLALGGYRLWLEYEKQIFNEYLASIIPLTTPTEVTIAAGTFMSVAAEQLGAASVVEGTAPFSRALVRLGRDRDIQAGHYRFEPGMSYHDVIEQLVNGDVHMAKFRLIEGSTFATVLANLASTAELQRKLAILPPAQAWQQIAPQSEHAFEGMLLPDTYLYATGSSDASILTQAHSRLLDTLEEEWQQRADGLPLDSAYEALILASIIEKETGVTGERKLIASVFVNRLRKGMRLQSDPTVIYGMGASFDGNLRKHDLQTDSPYNTYTRNGLPPTPIAIVSRAALHATLHPAESDYFYFVADGTGGHKFSKTLREHNNAVNRYQKNK